MTIPDTLAEYLLDALHAGLNGVNHGTSTYGDPADLHLNIHGHDARLKLKTAIAMFQIQKARTSA